MGAGRSPITCAQSLQGRCPDRDRKKLLVCLVCQLEGPSVLTANGWRRCELHAARWRVAPRWPRHHGNDLRAAAGGTGTRFGLQSDDHSCGGLRKAGVILGCLQSALVSSGCCLHLKPAANCGLHNYVFPAMQHR